MTLKNPGQMNLEELMIELNLLAELAERNTYVRQRIREEGEKALGVSRLELDKLSDESVIKIMRKTGLVK